MLFIAWSFLVNWQAGIWLYPVRLCSTPAFMETLGAPGLILGDRQMSTSAVACSCIGYGLSCSVQALGARYHAISLHEPCLSLAKTGQGVARLGEAEQGKAGHARAMQGTWHLLKWPFPRSGRRSMHPNKNSLLCDCTVVPCHAHGPACLQNTMVVCQTYWHADQHPVPVPVPQFLDAWKPTAPLAYLALYATLWFFFVFVWLMFK